MQNEDKHEAKVGRWTRLAAGYFQYKTEKHWNEPETLNELLKQEALHSRAIAKFMLEPGLAMPYVEKMSESAKALIPDDIMNVVEGLESMTIDEQRAADAKFSREQKARMWLEEVQARHGIDPGILANHDNPHLLKKPYSSVWHQSVAAELYVDAPDSAIDYVLKHLDREELEDIPSSILLDMLSYRSAPSNRVPPTG